MSGCIGPRGDAYRDLGAGDYDEAERYHRGQVEVLAGAGVDLVTALTLTNPAEAVGVARAAAQVGVPVVISFTVETDGKLPTGATVHDAIAEVDAATDAAPAYYMINCAHPDHFGGAFLPGDPVVERIRGVRANASRMSHAELDESDVLDEGDPTELGTQLAQLRTRRAARQRARRLLRYRPPAHRRDRSRLPRELNRRRVLGTLPSRRAGPGSGRDCSGKRSG